MAPVRLLVLFTTSCVAAVLSTVERQDDLHIAARNPQQAQNLDNEPVYTQASSGTTITKSLILTGIGPDPATNRWYDWDETCSDPQDRALIAATFDSVFQLAAETKQHLTDLKAGFPNQPINPKKDDDGNTNFVLQTDPAYSQYFNAKASQIDFVIDTFGLINDQLQKSGTDRTSGNTPGALRIICDKAGAVLDGAGNSYCGTDGQAITTSPYDPKRAPTIEPKYSFQTSSSIIFCPPFFDDSQFPNIDALQKGGVATLDKMDCRERILLHEMTHLKWIRSFPGRKESKTAVDIVGWLNAAQYATKGWGNFKKNPDNYAWLALYAYWNNKVKGCGADAWPDGVQKPTKQ